MVQNEAERPELISDDLKKLRLIKLEKADLDNLKQGGIKPTSLSRSGAVYLFRDRREGKERIDTGFLPQKTGYLEPNVVWRQEPQDKTDILDENKNYGFEARLLGILLPNEAELIQIPAGRKGGIIEKHEKLFEEATERGAVYLDITKVKEIVNGVASDEAGANKFTNNKSSSSFRG